ncbi:MAG: hypothetical protein ACFFFB_02005 [Candidatus Heimdallarchaeota archaeon]
MEELVKLITNTILTQPQKMIREEDLKNLCKNYDFDKIISEVYLNLKNVGFEFIKSKFLNETFYILTSEGKDDTISASQYGTLALILAISKEIDDKLKFEDLKEIFSEVWESDIEFLIRKDYLRKIEDSNILSVTPQGKALMKNIIQNLNLKNLLDLF